MSLTDFLNTLRGCSLEEANSSVEKICGVVGFFESEDYTLAAQSVHTNRTEYGDWQTNKNLANKVCEIVKERDFRPDVIVEPTCGTGSFILASLIAFGGTVRDIYGIEIYKPYINKTKFRLLDYALRNPGSIKCKIHLIHQNVFGLNFAELNIENERKVLVVGNPPWVTNSKLSEIESVNLPPKSNFKKVKGLDAITGKGNFDIAEYITYQLLDAFNDREACIALLIKNSVVRNIVYEQRHSRYNIQNITQYNIDAQREFDVSVAASLLLMRLGNGQARQCDVKDLYTNEHLNTYGWVDDCFVSNVCDYSAFSAIDGVSELTWWSGMKHDCSKVMELERKDGKLFNKLGEVVDVEPDLIFPLLKSSDLKDVDIHACRKYVIVTQTSTSDDTSMIKAQQPKTYKYLAEHSGWFERRKSIIYRNRPQFCIFGIGPYSFKPYKMAIAGLYKTTRFSLVSPINGKCVMMDDTCYLLGFENEEIARCFLKVLNSDIVQRFMQSLIFTDAKRSINKDLLMRINIRKAAEILLKDNSLTLKEYNQVVEYMNGRTTTVGTVEIPFAIGSATFNLDKKH